MYFIVIIHQNVALIHSIVMLSCINFPNVQILKFFDGNHCYTGLHYKFLYYLQRFFGKITY